MLQIPRMTIGGKQQDAVVVEQKSSDYQHKKTVDLWNETVEHTTVLCCVVFEFLTGAATSGKKPEQQIQYS